MIMRVLQQKFGEIIFLGDKKFKSRKLRNVIVSEEDKFWKFISQKRFINKEKDVSVGSYRIFVLQFINQLQLEESVQVFQDDKLNETTLSSDIVIFAKNSFELLDTFNGLRKKDK